MLHNPGWQYFLWTDQDNRQLVKQFYPWFLEVYDGFPKGIMRADAARYLYMHKFGGVYADLDFECLRPMEQLLENKQVVLAAMTNDTAYDQNVPNAWLASTPGHQFWYFCLQQIIKAAGCKNDRWDWVEATTGPVMLTTASRAYLNMGLPNVTVEAPGVIYPVDWRKTLWSPAKLEGLDEWSVCYPPHRAFNETLCKAKSPHAFAITYWTHTWKR
ncbi:hypothetical protein WJX72_002243 [[Myrmecia] bisecta]|uniref:Uncharacterized protein n=1 Tax=[Myrmecia] bisecta TaxID=41462 RepID=A0AAW1QAB3_9CHLO